ncbi:unnamed protein product [Rotaria magnacalcarata]|uniref:RWD domain-containing protein n=2 Tax=Rotaria magnacalcarata TaxID=392030 RepID=A0A814RJX9_9BILA|nr:unnamed protein product [Rotaria magnacalcarata]
MDTFEVRTDDLMTTTNETKSMSDGQDEEITSLRDHFKDKIRILSSIGQFSYILKIRPDQYDISLTLQLDKDYPSKPPEIIITAPRLAPDQIIVIQQLLQSYCETLLNKPMILSIYSRLLQWFDENNIQTVTIHSNTTTNNNNNQANSTSSSTQRSRKNSKTNFSLETVNNYSNEQETEYLKRSSMKTAEDVISRVEWDGLLDKRLFRVGYVDRFLGMQEKSFDDFDFKVDLSTVSDRHSSILAIPKHRIQYFKYNNEIIWDKETRTDLMFGSTGNKQTIYDVIERHKNSMESTDPSRTPDTDIVEKPNVTIPPPHYLTITDGAYKPNYFLSIPMTDPILISNYSNYQEHLLSSYPSMFSSHTSTSNLHLTLLTLHIETTSQIEQCIKLFNSLRDEIRYHCSYPDPINLEFNDVNTFHDKVLYVKCKKNLRLENLRTLIVQRLTEEQQKQTVHGIFCAGNYYEFVAHITLLKCKRKYSSIQQDETKEFNFGKQIIDCLRLCSIGKNENDDQKNNCVFQLDLS